jgi:hypothetical protein
MERGRMRRRLLSKVRPLERQWIGRRPALILDWAGLAGRRRMLTENCRPGARWFAYDVGMRSCGRAAAEDSRRPHKLPKRERLLRHVRTRTRTVMLRSVCNKACTRGYGSGKKRNMDMRGILETLKEIWDLRDGTTPRTEEILTQRRVFPLCN